MFLFLFSKIIMSIGQQCLNGTLPCVDSMDFIMGDVTNVEIYRQLCVMTLSIGGDVLVLWLRDTNKRGPSLKRFV